MPTFKALITSSALAVLASSVDAATITFNIEADVSHITRNVDADVSSGDTIQVQGTFDTASLFDSRVDNRLRYGDVSNVKIKGPVFGGFDDFQVKVLEFRDDESGIESDLLRLIIDFGSGPTINDDDYDLVRLSFYIPMAVDSFDTETFLALGNDLTPELLPAQNGRTAVMSGAFRFPTSQDGQNGGFRGEVTSLRLAPVPLPASGLLLVTVVGGLGFAKRRRKG